MGNRSLLTVRTIHEALLSSAERFAANELLRYGDEALTYEAFAMRVNEVARSLAAMQLRPADRIAFFVSKQPRAIQTIFAAFQLNVIVVPINPRATPAQVAQILDDCDCRVLVTTQARWLRLSGVLVGIRAVLVDRSGSAGGMTLGWDELLSDSVSPSRIEPLDVDPAAILYTSGSTGAPKGVLLSHRNIAEGAISVASYLKLDQSDIILGALPLSFDAGFSQLTTAMVTGARYVAMDYVRPNDVVRACMKEMVTVLTGVPAFWMQVTSLDWEEPASSHVRKVASTGGRVPEQLLARIRRIFERADVYLMYGFTEAFRSTYLSPQEIDARPGSVGKAVPNAHISILRPDGSECAPDEHGELVHRGAFVAMGYWNNPEASRKRFRSWPSDVHTRGMGQIAAWSGDIAYKDKDGFVYILGRNDEMIKTSGYRVSPSEVETACFAHPEVKEALAVGIPDEDMGEVIGVCLALHVEVNLQDLQRTVSDSLPNYMRPKVWHVMDSLPRNGNGKFDRTVVMQMLADRYNRETSALSSEA